MQRLQEIAMTYPMDKKKLQEQFDTSEVMKRLLSDLFNHSSEVQRATALIVLKKYINLAATSNVETQTEFASFEAMVKHFEDQQNMLMTQIQIMEQQAAEREKEIVGLSRKLNEQKNIAAGFKADKL